MFGALEYIVPPPGQIKKQSLVILFYSIYLSKYFNLVMFFILIFHRSVETDYLYCFEYDATEVALTENVTSLAELF